MSTRNKTGGGRGTNQYQIKGRAKEKQAKPKTATSLVQAKPERRSLEGLPNGGLGVRSPKERLEDIRDLCLEQGKDLREVLRSAWGKAHPREPLPVEWELASSMGQVWVPDEYTLYCAEGQMLGQRWPYPPMAKGEILRSSGHIWETCLFSDGDRVYFRDHQIHRENGPAVIGANGSVEYYVEGKHHRTDGPAVIRADGSVEYWVGDRQITKTEFLARYGQPQANRSGTV